MKSNLSTLFKNDWESTSQETELLAKVFSNIDKERAKAIKTQKIIWSASSVVFLFVTIVTGWHAVSSIISSDTGSYISLVFSDTGSAITLWREITISIVESLPIIGIGLFLASIYLLFWSARKYSVRTHNLAY